MPPRNTSFKDYVMELLAPLGVAARPMFGGFGLYAADVFFGILAADVLYLKVDDSNRSEYEKAKAPPFPPCPLSRPGRRTRCVEPASRRTAVSCPARCAAHRSSLITASESVSGAAS